MDLNILDKVRGDIYRFFLQGNGTLPSDDLLKLRHAEVYALMGDFPRGFEILLKVEKARMRRNGLERLVLAFRRSISLPHELDETEDFDDLGILLWRGYFDAARLYVKFFDRGSAFSYLRIYEVTKSSQDLNLARRTASRTRDIGSWLVIVKAARRIDDIVAVEQLLKEEVHIHDQVAYLVKLYEVAGKDDKYLRQALGLAQEFSPVDDDDFGLQRAVKIWRTIFRVSNDKAHWQKFVEARRAFRRLKRAEKDEYRERKNKRTTGSLEGYLELSQERESLRYLRKFIKLAEQSPVDRAKIAMQALDAIDKWQGKRVPPRKFRKVDPGPNIPVPDLLRDYPASQMKQK